MENDWFLAVPKILHCYFGGETMPYIRYMTIKSFMNLNPDWEIMLWYPQHLFTKHTWDSFELKYEVSCDNYLPELMKLPIKKTAVDFTEIGFINDAAEALKADFLRVYILYVLGGAWTDTDILFFKPITSLSVNVPENTDKETFVCVSSYGHSCGLIMSSPGSKFFGRMADVSSVEYNPNGYQSLGPTMFNKYFPTFESVTKFSPAANIGMDSVYAHDANHIGELLDGTKPRFTEGSIGCHWYAGHPLWSKFIKDTNGGKQNLPDCVIGNLLKI